MATPKVALTLAVARGNDQQLAGVFALLADRHDRDADVRDQSTLMATWSDKHIALLEPMIKRYGRTVSERPERLRAAMFAGTRIGSLGLLDDLKDTALMVQEQELTWTALDEAAQELRDKELLNIVRECKEETTRQLTWLKSRQKEMAGMTLTVSAAPMAELRASLPKHASLVAIPDPIWAPVAVALLALAVGVPAILVGLQPWLTPSLGPTAFLQTTMPAHPSSRLWNTVLGHLGGLIAGFAGVALFNAGNDPVVLVDHTLTLARLGAAVVALALTMIVGALLRANHPPAAATTLIVALGSLSQPNAVMAFLIGLAILAMVGEVVRRLRLGELSWGRMKVRQREAAG